MSGGRAASSAAPSFASVLKHTGIYGLGNVGIRIAGLLLVPLYTYNLTPAEYGVIEYLDLTAVAIGMLFSLGLANAIYRFYYQVDPPARRRVISTALLPVLAISFVIAAALFAAAPRLAADLFHDPRFTGYLRILFVGFGFSMVAEFGMSYFAVLQRSALFSTITIVKFVAGASLNVLFLVVYRWGVQGILVSNLITNVALGAILLVKVVRENGIEFDTPLFRKMVAYGYPLVLVQVSLFGINFADRFFLQAYGGFEQVGIYALAYKFGIMLNTLVVASFFQVWNAKAFEVASDPEARPFYARVFTYFSLGLIAAGLGMSLVIRDIVAIVAPPAYLAAAALVPFVILAYVGNGIGSYFELGLKLTNRTPLLSAIFVGTFLLCLGLYVALIPPFGMYGAVAATVIAFGVKAAAVYGASRRVYPIPFEFGRILRAALPAAGLLAAQRMVPPLPLLPSIVLGVAFFALYLVGLWFWWLRPDERATMALMLRRATGRLRPVEVRGAE